MKHETAVILKTTGWVLAGMYFAIATYGGSAFSIFIPFMCGWMAGREYRKRDKHG